MKRIGLTVAVVTVFFLLSFGICLTCGWFTPDWTLQQLEGLPRTTCALLVFGLLMSDLLLPIPTTIVLSAAGMTIGWPLAAASGFAGLLAGNLLGYLLCRGFGGRIFERFVSEAERQRFGFWLKNWGPAALLISRPIPMMSETLSCLAGLGAMNFWRFLLSLSVGTIPFVVFFAWMGQEYGQVRQQPGLVLIIALVLPALFLVGFHLLNARRKADAKD